MPRRTYLALSAALALASSACTLGPQFQRLAGGVPDRFTAQTGPVAGQVPVQATTPWWQMLEDPMLNNLVARARQANPDLGRAQAAVAEARAVVAQAQAGGTPQLNAGSSGTYGRSFSSPSYYNRTSAYGSAGFDASWEVDLWGKNRRNVEAATANEEAVQAELDDAMLTLLGDVARTYVELRGIQAQRAAAQASVDNQRRANELTVRRMAGGNGSRLEILQGQTLQQQQEAQLPILDAQAQVLINGLSTLCGEPPDALSALLLPDRPIPQGPVPQAGIPADLIRRRPDVRAAERQLAVSIALVGAAMADKYPSLSLSGTLSLSASSVGSIMALPLFALAPTLRVPLLDGGQRQAAVDIRQAQAEQARFAYRTAVLKALREVEDAIARLRGETLRRDQLRQTIATAQQVVDTARSLYTAGATDFLQVLDAQRALNQSRDALAQAEAARTIQVVSLFKALGGGWQASP